MTIMVEMKGTYDRCLFWIQITLMLLDAFLAAKEDEAIAQVLLNLPISLSTQTVAMHIILISTLVVRLLNLSICSTWFMADKAQSINLYLFTFDQSCGTLNR